MLFELDGETLTLTASDSETTIRTVINVENTEGAGKVAFGTKLLLDTLKELPEQPVTFVIDDQSFSLNISTANGNYSYVGTNGNQYPEMQQLENEHREFIIDAETLLGAINKTIFCTTDEVIYYEIIKTRGYDANLHAGSYQLSFNLFHIFGCLVI